MLEAQMWPTDDPANEGALVHVLTIEGDKARVRKYDGTEMTVPVAILERRA